MSKNLTRKGLAFGALVALGSSAIAGTPAFAVDAVSLEASAGTTYSTILGESFTLKSIFTDAAQVGSEKLAFEVTDASSVVDLNAVALNGSDYDADGATNGDQDPTLDTNKKFVVIGGNTMAPASNSITIKATGSATTTVVVKAFLDYDGGADLDSNETVSTTQTITFVKAADVTWSTDFTAPVIGDAKFLANVSAAPSINLGQVAYANYGIIFQNTTDSKEQYVDGASTTFDATTGKLKWNPSVDLDADLTDAASSPQAAVLAGKRYTAQAVYAAGVDESTAEANVIGTQVAYAVAAATIGTIADATTASSSSFKLTDNSGSADAVKVRSSVTSIPVSLLVKDTASPAVALANTKITVTLTENSTGGNTDAATFVAGGKTLQDTTGSAEAVSFDVTTGSDGKASFTVVATGAKSGDAFTVSAAAQGVSTAYSTVYTIEDAKVSSVENTNVVGGSAVLKTAKSAAATLNYAVLDQFGSLIPDAGLRLKIGDGTDSYYPAVTGGKASQALTYTAEGTKTITAEVQLVQTNGNYSDLAAHDAKGNGTSVYNKYASDVTATSVSLVVGTSNAASAVTLSAARSYTTNPTTTKLALNNNALVAADTRLGETGPTVVASADTAAGNVATLSGNVTDSTGAATYSTVKLSATGVQFVSGTVSALDSITVQTDASGAFGSVKVYSNKAGKVTVTATAGSVTKTLEVEFAAAGEDSGTAIALATSQVVKAGRTLVITGTLTDKYGNVVDSAADDFSAVYTGPGYEFTSAVTQTGAAGTFTIRVLLGTGEVGVGSVAVAYDPDGSLTSADSDADRVSASQTILIGISATVSAAKKAATTVVKNAAGASVTVVSGTKSVTKVATSDDFKVSLTKLTAGKKTVKVYVNDILVSSKSVTVKK